MFDRFVASAESHQRVGEVEVQRWQQTTRGARHPDLRHPLGINRPTGVERPSIPDELIANVVLQIGEGVSDRASVERIAGDADSLPQPLEHRPSSRPLTTPDSLERDADDLLHLVDRMLHVVVVLGGRRASPSGAAPEPYGTSARVRSVGDTGPVGVARRLDPPAGLVTFVFTDIEGSTRLFRRIGDRYPVLLDRHHEILRAAWQAFDGYEVKTEGDAFFVAFEEASSAIEACVLAQRNLALEPWPHDATIRVRIGVHVGLAYPRDGDYVAFAVHQAARVVSAGHGGQIVVSADCVSQAADLSVGLRSLGRYRVRDFDGATELFQVVGSGLGEGFPPLRVLPADGHNLVTPVTSLVGREEDLVELARLIEGGRMVTVVGPGGLGKTRLVVEHGLERADGWEHGVWFVDLAKINDPAAIPQAVAEATAAPVAPDDDVWTAVLEHLRDRHALLVFDNCEHVTIAAATLVESLLRGCPKVQIVATSREPLGLRAERVWRPRPLDAGSSGVELFMARAGLDERDEQSPTRLAVIELCERLDGLPLAIELAAARADVLGPAEIVARLDVQRGLLASRDPTLDTRQRSLDDLITWSYELLSVDERSTLRRLGVFAGSFDLEAASAAAAGGGVDRYDVPELLWSLLSKSLLATDVGGGSTRYRMLVTVRTFVRQHLGEEPDDVAAVTHLAEHYLASFGPQLDKLDATTVSDRSRELDNIRGLIHLIDSREVDTAQLLACIVIADGRRSSRRAAVDEGRAYLEQLPAVTPSRAALLTLVAHAAIDAGAAATGAQLLGAAATLATTSGTPPWLDGRVESLRGILALVDADYASARAISLAGLERTTTARGRSYLLNVLAVASLELDDYDTAREANERNLDELSELGAGEACRIPLNNLAEIALRVGDRREAAARQLQALDLALTYGSMDVVAFSLIVAARLSEDRPATAVRLQASADTQLEHIGYSLLPGDRQLSDDLLNAAASSLGVTAFTEARQAGAELSLQDAIAEGRRVLSGVGQDSPPASHD